MTSSPATIPSDQRVALAKYETPCPFCGAPAFAVDFSGRYHKTTPMLRSGYWVHCRSGWVDYDVRP